MKPVIGITPTPSLDALGHGTFRRYALASTYTEGVEHAGGIPFILPPQAGNIDQILDRIDGVLFSGGGDIDPQRYADPHIHEKTYGIDELRDQFELDLFHASIERDLPVLCICRGIQVANVALGGDLIQDVADQHGTEVEHRQQAVGYGPSDKTHTVNVEPGSHLAEIYGSTEIETNSFHHQALRTVGPGLVVVGRAADGIIEAVERPGSRWFLAVQWHPEMMFEAHREHLTPFEALTRAAASVGEASTAIASD